MRFISLVVPPLFPPTFTLKGKHGFDGAKGEQGASGEQGPGGVPGPSGDKGASGKSVSVSICVM